MTAQHPGQRPERDEAVPADGRAPVPDTPPMSELLASCAAAAAVSSPPSRAESTDGAGQHPGPDRR